MYSIYTAVAVIATVLPSEAFLPPLSRLQSHVIRAGSLRILRAEKSSEPSSVQGQVNKVSKLVHDNVRSSICSKASCIARGACKF
jgi:hypothetical protein